MRRIVVVGSGTHFLSGISVYSIRLASALAEARNRVGLLTMRRLIPARLYPGWRRVGADLTDLERDSEVAAYDGVDWFWIPSLVRGAWFMARQRPDIVIFQWWTGTIVHSYIVLAVWARLIGARIVVEYHEIVPVEESRVPLLAGYVRIFAPIFFRLAHGYTVHSAFDRDLVLQTWRLPAHKPLAVLPHGPHDHYVGAKPTAPLREAPEHVVNLLFFGVIRPYKGLEDLIVAFERIPEEEIGRFWLTVVGETWEGYGRPVEMIEQSPRRQRVTLVNRYVTDVELDGYVRGADVVVLPYTRSSLSGPLHVAMGYGVPIVMTDVGGNAEASAGYGGIVLVPPSDPTALSNAIRSVTGLIGQNYQHPHSWGHTAQAYETVFSEILQTTSK